MEALFAQMITGSVIILLVGVVWKTLIDRINSKVDRSWCEPTHSNLKDAIARLQQSCDDLNISINSLNEKLARLEESLKG